MTSPERAVTLTRGEVEYSVSIVRERLPSRQIGQMLQLQPTSVWLRSAYSRRVFLTNESGDFDLTSVTEYSVLEVEGVAITTHADQPQLSATSLTLSSMGPSGNDSPGPSSVGFTSVINGRPPTARTRTSARKRKFSNPILAVSSFTLKVVVTRIVSGNEEKKPVFQKYDQVFIPMEESSATLPFVLAAVRDQVGDEYIIVTPDGLEVRDSAGTRGFKFWKANARKFYAISEEENDVQHSSEPVAIKRSRKINAESEATTSATMQIQADIADIRDSTSAILSLTKLSKIPLGLKRLLKENLSCQICSASPIQPPVVMAKCCHSIIGCEVCVNAWFSGPEALTKSCPRCSSERGYNETMRLMGLDDLLLGIKDLFTD
eukprot:Em0004g278a